MNNEKNRFAIVIDEVCNGNKSAFARKLNITPPYAAQIYSGERIPGDRTLKDICREFNVDEVWLRSGIGEPFKAVSRADEISAFIGKVLGNDGTPIQQTFITVLARTTPDEWSLFEIKLLELAAEVKNIKAVKTVINDAKAAKSPQE